MIQKIEKTITGDEITVLIPETEQEERSLLKKVKNNEVEELGSMQEASDEEVEDILGY